VDSRVRRTFSVSEEEERRRLRVPKSAVYSSLSARYDGAVPCRHRYTKLACSQLFSQGHPANWARRENKIIIVFSPRSNFPVSLTIYERKNV